MAKKKTWIMKLDRDDPEKELEFEIRYRLSLSARERFQRMLQRSLEIAQMKVSHGHKKTPLIIQRS